MNSPLPSRNVIRSLSAIHGEPGRLDMEHEILQNPATQPTANFDKNLVFKNNCRDKFFLGYARFKHIHTSLALSAWK